MRSRITNATTEDESAEQELEALALEGLNSGESIAADDDYWEQKRARLIALHKNWM
ncbi:MAG: hypothetical protein ACRD7E_25215 [Bryobacteraceae bacterium]